MVAKAEQPRTNFPQHLALKTCLRNPDHAWVGSRILCPYCRGGEEIRVTPGEAPAKKKPKKKKGTYTPWRESVVATPKEGRG